MRKYKIINIITLVIAFVLITTNHTYASKEDLEKDYSGPKGGRAAEELVSLFNTLDEDGDKYLSMDELSKASDEEINTLAKIHQSGVTFGPLQQKLFTDSSGTISREYNDRRVAARIIGR